ncbi:MAG TPA: bifunctional isocitrate dehydrogenase kinase/phosphatase [Thermoanaerobaculia bacterium]|nr:bifunctional isocitrate dehydrogenase kinase/phosphatase [Thermoanaerobaculia bacterium]
MDPQDAVAHGADTIHWAFDEYRQRVQAINRRVQQRFERSDWAGIRQDTVERLGLHTRSVLRVWEVLSEQLGDRRADRALWAGIKEAYTATILGRDDFELAQTFFNSLSRKVFGHDGVDPDIDFASDEVPLPYHGWEMASARMYAVRRVDAGVVRKILEDAGFRVPFRDLEGDCALAAASLGRALVEQFGTAEIEALDVLQPIFFRNKGAYVVGRARRRENGSQGEPGDLPLLLPIVNRGGELEVDAVLHSEDEASIVFSFARWYFHADVESPREVIGFLRSILPRKRVAELYISLGYTKHGKTELYRDLSRHIASSDKPFQAVPGQRGLVMSVFGMPEYPFVFKLIKDKFPPQKTTTRETVREKYREVLQHDRVGRLVDFQDYEHLKVPRARFDPELLEELLRESSLNVEVRGDDVIIRHVYVERRVTPLDVFLREAGPEEALAAISDWGRCVKDLAAANIFPGDILLKNFGVTRHGRVVFYDYDEVGRLTDCRFLPFPKPRHDFEEMSSETWFAVGEADVFPEELGSFLGLDGERREAFLKEHGDLFEVGFWRRMQERNRAGEIIEFFPYPDERRLRPRTLTPQSPLPPALSGPREREGRMAVLP